MATKINSRQIISSDLLQQLVPNLSGQELDDLLRAINSDLTSLLRLEAANPNSLVVNVGPGVVSNAVSGRNRSIPHINKVIPNFTSGTITFPAASGGTITVSPGTNITLTVSNNNFIKATVYLDATGGLGIVLGTENASEASATVSPAPSKTLPVGYITLFNNAGTIQNVAQNKIYQFAAGAGGGSGTGSGIGDDLNSVRFKASFGDGFDDLTAVNSAAGFTDSNLYSIVNEAFTLSYDATKTVSTTGTAATMSSAPTFTVKAGDVLRSGTEARRITNVATQTSYTLESAFSSNLSSAACTVSQAVHTADLRAFDGAGTGLSIATAFPSDSFQTFLMFYRDADASASDIIWDINTTPDVAFQASADNSSFSGVLTRKTSVATAEDIYSAPTAGSQARFRFFANKTSGSGTVNLLDYKVFMHEDNVAIVGETLNQAYCLTNGAGTEINCTVSSSSGRTRIQTNWSFPMGVNPGTAQGSIEVYINGQLIPRFVDSTLTADASYTELNSSLIELDADYSATPLSVFVKRHVSVIDNTSENVTNISYLQQNMAAGFQGFVDTSQRMVATATTGAPAAGLFHSSIVGRSDMPDLRNDLGVRFGVERIVASSIAQIPNEFGPNGETVWRATNDNFNRIRFVGSFVSIVNNNGQFLNTTTQNDYVEITFYGTGLNFLIVHDVSTRDYRASVDGGAEGANLIPTTASTFPTTARGYSSNTVFPAASGLSLGIHTVKIRVASSNGGAFYGFEVINQNATATNVSVRPGIAYSQGKKIVDAAESLVAFNSVATGTRGGRVVTFVRADGTVGQSWQAVDASQLNLTAANHVNEEVARVHNWREFGAGRADDFSLTFGTSNRAFTLEDGTTTLVGNSVSTDVNQNLSLDTNSTSFVTITFVGTGLDISWSSGAGTNSNANAHTVSIDGGAAQNFTTVGTGAGIINVARIVSGLPYGTHTVRFSRNAPSVWGLTIRNFIVYQPKKPSIPAGAVELADYNVMANFSQVASSGLETVSTGVLRKTAVRENIYVGTWTVATLSAINDWNGFGVFTSTTNDYVQYSFFGTGFDLRWFADTSVSNNVEVRLNGNLATSANFPTASFAVVGTNLSPYNTSTGILSQRTSAGTTIGASFAISNLPLGLYTVRLTRLASTGGMLLNGFDIITPIHASGSSLPYDLQNALPVGSLALADSRKFSAIKEASAQDKNISQALGITSSPTTTSTTHVPLPDLSVAHFSKTGKVKISFSSTFTGSIASGQTIVLPHINGVAMPSERNFMAYTGGATGTISDSFTVDVPKDQVSKIDIFWRTSTGTATAISNSRQLTVEDV
jgi:hypothetical protein